MNKLLKYTLVGTLLMGVAFADSPSFGGWGSYSETTGTLNKNNDTINVGTKDKPIYEYNPSKCLEGMVC
ncbi:MAG: hypothetical protein P8L77_05820 [Gammaproteobacteria bacterium]|nr:hypothetical protein [Gammaproteobacteria bacterium]